MEERKNEARFKTVLALEAEVGKEACRVGSLKEEVTSQICTQIGCKQ